MSNISFYSYGDLIKERNQFRMVDFEGLGRFDTPSALFYKLVFYFSDESGLLGLNGINGFNDNVQERLSGFTHDKYRLKNTAYNFLLLNDELERAEMLKNFLILLSEINSKSPWYFQEISGLDTALERKLFSENEFKVEDKPGQIQIKCLNDAYDDRIGTLLDLYRASCFSYQNKKEIVPRNLRKFNMGILIFSAPIRGKGGKSGDKNERIKIPSGDESNLYIPSTKLIELRNCEFDYNSAKSAIGTLNTTDAPFSPQYTITISFDDCYESRYNEIMQQVITDFINIDINQSRTGNDLKDIKSYGKSIDYENVKIDPSESKYYWLDTDISSESNSQNQSQSERNIGELHENKLRDEFEKPKATPLYEHKLRESSTVGEKQDSRDISDIAPPLKGKSMLANAFEGKVKQVGDLIKDAVQLPGVKTTTNIHDIGSVSNYGEFEYLNRITGSDGILGTAAQQIVGLGAKAAKDKINKLYMGNLYDMSVSDMFDIAKRALSGDIAGTMGMAKTLSNNSTTMPTAKDELYGDQQQRKFQKPKTKTILESDSGSVGTPKKVQQKNSLKEIWEDPEQREYTAPETKELYTDVQQRVYDKPDDEIWSDVQQRVIGKPDSEIWSDVQQRVIGKPDSEIWNDVQQRVYDKPDNEIWSDVQQRTYDKPETTQIPGYTQTRTSFIGKMNKSKSLRNNL
jgi:hypothetical protein